MLFVERFVNELMSSNCFVVWDNEMHRCVIIDPASEKAEREINYIEENHLFLDYILLTHEHTDHTWGVNALLEKYDSAKVICSVYCREALPTAGNMYFRLYYDDPNYTYKVKRVDYTTEELNWELLWNNYKIEFIHTPGHSQGSICINIDNYLFTGDTIMQYKPYINKRGGNLEVYKNSVATILSKFMGAIQIFPGHGESFPLSAFGYK